MKNDFAIKFNSLEEYREIEKFLENEGYTNDKFWNEEELLEYHVGFVCINNAVVGYDPTELFTIFEDNRLYKHETFSNLEEYKATLLNVIDWSRITKIGSVKLLLKQREMIENKIRLLDEMALVKYELEQLKS